MDDLGNVDLDAFQILILPDGYYSISDEAMTQVKTWMRAGGKVIAIGSALRQFNEKEGFALKQYADSAKADEIKKAEEQDQLDLRLERYDSATRRDISSQLPGAVFKASVDPSHPLGFGLGEVYYTLKTDSESYEHLVDAENVIYLGESPEYYGFVGYKALENQKNSVVCATEQQGQGTIVYLVDNPLFRGFWENGKFLFCNALFFAGN